MKLLIASRNQNKIKEIMDFFYDLNIEILSLNDYQFINEVKEDALTFKGNALKKARSRAIETGILTLADDSGLELDYLNGKPGIYSARFAGYGASDEDNNSKLLRDISNVPMEKRTARFKTVIALFDPVIEREYIAEGICEGIILEKPRGNNGFGYDPLFLIPELNKTMAEMTLKEKNIISHRAKALKIMRAIIKDRYLE
jgi:XTP/dITP diphosphohydrolase